MSNLSPKVILDYDYGSYKGYFAENFAAQEFLYSGKERLYSWERKTAEVEFLREFDGTIIPIEVKSGSVTKAKSLNSFTQQYDSPYSIVLSGKNYRYSENQKRYYYPLYLASQIPN